ncbi:MAG: hypothetical protein EOO09_22585, partial [Chitinophagaceae bacterium]
MIETSEDIKKHFQAPAGTFWHWAGPDVVEWVVGHTICYKVELVSILEQLPATAVPRLASILLLLSACRESSMDRIMGSFQNLATTLGKNDPAHTAAIDEAMTDVRLLLDAVHSLAPAIRTGENRAHLIAEILSSDHTWWSYHETKAALEELKSGLLAEFVLQPGPQLSAEHFLADLNVLSASYRKYGSPEKLLYRLKTGLPDIPSPAAIPDIPAIPRNLLDELEGDERTSLLARLTRQVIAVFHLPLHSS